MFCTFISVKAERKVSFVFEMEFISLFVAIVQPAPRSLVLWCITPH